MTKREVNLKIFEKKAENQVLFQPRIEWWYQYNKIRGTLPPRYQKMDLLGLFDDLNVSIRYFSYATGLPGAIRARHSKKVKLEEKTKGEKKFLICNTPKGELVEELRQSSDGVPPPADIERVRIISEMVSDSDRKLGVS